MIAPRTGTLHVLRARSRLPHFARLRHTSVCALLRALVWCSRLIFVGYQCLIVIVTVDR